MKGIPLAGVLLGMVTMATTAAAQTASPAPGVALDSATRRAGLISDLRYGLSLSIPAELASPISGTIEIRFTLADASAPLVLDFDVSRDQVKSADVNGRPAAFTSVNGHVVIPASALVSGANSLRIAFTAGDGPLNRSADFLYSLFVPARARQAIPCFDQPDLKGRWTVTLEHPAAWQSVSNGAEAARTTSGARATVRFVETPPLPTYLVAFVAGDFKVETARRRGRTFRMFHRETDAAKVARNRDAIFDLHAKALDFLERYTAIPYAFGKFDFVVIPAFQFGGMEHAGQILYNASAVLLDASATQNQLLNRASVISHETAHMWFGDLVTMRWFDDVWMKEVCANFMAAKMVNPSFPTVNHDLRFLLSNYPDAYEVDRTAGANPIRQGLDNLAEAGSLYGAIIYEKAPIVMRHLEAIVGETGLRNGLREYLKAHAFGNATWNDLITILDRRTPVDLVAWSRAWVERAGRPTIETDLDVRDGRIARLAFRQSDPRQRSFTWPQQLRIVVGGTSSRTPLVAEMNGPVINVPRAVGLPAPRYVLPNAGGWAYGDFALDPESLRYLVASLPDIDDALTRGSAWVTLWDAMLDGHVRPPAFIELALRALPREADEQLTARVLGYTADVWWRFLGAGERRERVARLELTLREGLARAVTASQKASWFNALRNVSQTEETVGWLRQVWAKEASVPGLPLAEPDYTALALELAVREVDGWQNVLGAQLTRIENPDRRARFQFVMPALSADPAERERWFLALGMVENRRREPWVLEGLSYLHHPLRAAASQRYVPRSLQMLWDIQKTGDIFFPKRWLDATLGGHSSREMAAAVRTFLEGLPPDYPERLRNITLQSADGLFRAAAIAPEN